MGTTAECNSLVLCGTHLPLVLLASLLRRVDPSLLQTSLVSLTTVENHNHTTTHMYSLCTYIVLVKFILQWQEHLSKHCVGLRPRRVSCVLASCVTWSHVGTNTSWVYLTHSSHYFPSTYFTILLIHITVVCLHQELSYLAVTSTSCQHQWGTIILKIGWDNSQYSYIPV